MSELNLNEIERQKVRKKVRNASRKRISINMLMITNAKHSLYMLPNLNYLFKVLYDMYSTL